MHPSFSSPVQPHLASPSPLPIPVPQQPSLSHHFTWHSIWSLFINTPRARSWLFCKHAPPRAQVVKSLLNRPMLLGYVFGSVQQDCSHNFPDIGDLFTVFSNEDDLLLGFHFGYQGIQPILPLLYLVSKDPCLQNPRVLVRRTATIKAPFNDTYCFLSIEFNWCQSGALSVVTNVHLAPPPSSSSNFSAPFFDTAEFRVFDPSSADRFARAAQLLDDNLCFPHLVTDIHSSTQLLFNPHQHSYSLVIREPHNPINLLPDSTAHTSNHPGICPPISLSHASQHIDAKPLSPSQSSPFSPNLFNESLSPVPTSTGLWDSYQNAISRSKRSGIFISTIYNQLCGPGTPSVLYRTKASYNLMTSLGINLKGRIQKICARLGIDCPSPLGDRNINCWQNSIDEVGLLAYEAEPEAESAEGNYDITSALLEREMALKRRRSSNQLSETLLSDSLGDMPAVDMPLLFKASDLQFNPSLSTSVDNSLFGVTLDNTASGLCAVAKDDVRECKRRTSKRKRWMEQPACTDGDFGLNMQSALIADELNLDSITLEEEEVGFGYSAGTCALLDTPLKLFDPGATFSESLKRRRSPESVSVQQVQHGMCSQTQSSLGTGPPGPPADDIVMENVETKTGCNYGNTPDTSVIEQLQSKTSGGLKQMAEDGSSKNGATIWTCDRCGVQIRGKKGNLNRHIANKHENIRAHGCEEANCGKRFQTRLNLERHKKAVHEGRPFTCPSCPRTFKTSDDLDAHVSSAHEETDGALACNICGSCFGRRSTLNRHQAKVHKYNNNSDSKRDDCIS